MKLGAAAVMAVAALALPGAAFAHATPIRSVPGNGAVLTTAPRAVTVEFDDTIRLAGGNAAVANATQTSVLGGPAFVRGRTLTLPLRAHLPRGAYSVRWSIVSDDGHREEGVLAFAVGAGSPTPTSVLGAGVPLTWSDILLRTLYYLGLLAGGGVAVFGLRVQAVLGDRLTKPLAHLLFFALLFVFLGGSGIVHTAPPGTRFALVLKAALTVALVGGACAALAPGFARLRWAAGAAALALLAAPTLSGHALDPSQPRLLSVASDLAHLAAAAVWFGGLLALVYVVPRASTDERERAAVAERFSTTALAAVIVLAGTGAARALTELSAVSQLWTTSYGRALIVKTAIFVPLLGVGWVNRTLLLRAFSRLRRSATLEAAAIVGIVVAVAILTELRPGVEATRARAAPTVLARPPVLPPRDAVVDARELGTLAVGVARTPGRATVTLLGPDGTGVDGRSVAIDGLPATACGPGCYHAAAADGPVTVTVGGATLRFAIPARSPDRAAALAAITRSFRSARTVVWDETLASTPANAQTTRFVVVAPNRLSYRTRGGPSAIVIGDRRWDRANANAPWTRSAQTPLDEPAPYWTRPTNVHEVAPGVITFLDRRIPAWFRVEVDGGLPRVTHMTAASHFMTDRYVGFDVPAAVSPPPSR